MFDSYVPHKIKKKNYYDKNDRDGTIESNIPLVVSIAKKRFDNGVDFEDLVSEGIIGLITAYEKFEPERGFRFSTYATWWIMQAVDDIILKQGDSLRKPSNYGSFMKSIIKASSELENALGREPTHDEISAKTGMSIIQIKDRLSLGKNTMSLDEHISHSDFDNDFTYKDQIVDKSLDVHDCAVQRALKDNLYEAMDRILDEREQRVMALRFGLEDLCIKYGYSQRPHSLREVGRKFELSPERIRQIEEKALEKIKSKNNGNLSNYLLED